MLKQKVIRSMGEIQRKYFPKDVGKKCPCCGKEIEHKQGYKVKPGWVKEDRGSATSRACDKE